MDATQIINHLQHYSELIAVLFPTLASALQYKVVKWLSLEKGWVIKVLTTTVAVLVTVIPAAIGIFSKNDLLVHGISSLGIMTIAYWFIKPAGQMVQDAKTLRSATTNGTTTVNAAVSTPVTVVATPAPSDTTTSTPVPPYEG